MPRLYLETTIPSYLTAWPSRDLIVAAHQQLAKEWWRARRDAFEICISQFVLDEAGVGDAEAARERLEVLQPFPLLDISESVLELATTLLQSGAIPQKAARDAAHICDKRGAWDRLSNDVELRSYRKCHDHQESASNLPAKRCFVSSDLHAGRINGELACTAIQ